MPSDDPKVMPPKSTKRTKHSFDDNSSEDLTTNQESGPSSFPSKKVRFDESGSNDEDEFEFEADLETKKKKRGAVNTDGYGSDQSNEESDEEGLWAKKNKAATEDDMFAEEDINSTKDNKKKTKYLTIDQIQGQEFVDPELNADDVDSDGEPRIMAFNMKEDLEEGKFDEEGNFVRNQKDPNAYHDRWMEGMSKRDILAAREAQERQEQRAALIEAQKLSQGPQTENEIRIAILEYLEPSETVVEALQRLGGGKNKKSLPQKRIPAWKAKKLAAKKSEGEMVIDNPEENAQSSKLPEEEKQRKEKIDNLTDLISKMVGLGHFYVYDDDFYYERIIRDLKREGAVPPDWMPNTTSTPQPTTQWEYRWITSNGPEDGNTEVYGPFSGEQMKTWNEQGYFSQGIMVRNVGGDWKSNEGIDFLTV